MLCVCVADAAGVGNVYDVLHNPVFQCLIHHLYPVCLRHIILSLPQTFLFFFLLCCLFNDTVSDLDYLAPNYVRKMTVNLLAPEFCI